MADILSGPSCHSCGMLIMRPDEFGTEANGVKRLDYCRYCYDKGAFTEPDMTFDRMVEKISSAMIINRKSTTPEQAKQSAVNLLRKLKRWQPR